MSVTDSTLKDTSNTLPATAQVLIQRGKITENIANELMQRVRQSRSNFIAEVINAGHIDAADMALPWHRRSLFHCLTLLRSTKPSCAKT